MYNSLRTWPALLSSFLVVGLLALILACAGPANTPEPTPTPTPPPDPRAILSRAADQLAAEPHLEFVLEHPVGSTPLVDGLNLVGAQGVASLPDRSRISLDMEASGTAIKLSVIVVDEAAYMTNMFSGAWESVPRDYVPFRFDLVAASMGELLNGVSEPSLVGETDLDGAAAYHIEGEGPAGSLGQLIPGTQPDAVVPAEFWVNKADGKLRQVRLSGPLVEGDPPDTVRLVRLNAPPQPPEITAPELGTVGR